MADLSSRQVKKYASIPPYDTNDEKMTGDITYMGKRKYVHDYVYDVVQPVTYDFAPDDIDDTTVYIVPLQASGKMNNCKRTRPWGYGQTSKSKSFTKGPRLLYNCRGSYCCTNGKFANIVNFGINRLEFQQKGGVMIFSLFGEKAAYLPCEGRLILEKDTEKNIITAKKNGTHSCPIEVKGRNKDVSDIAKRFACLTGESMVRQKVQQQLEQSSFSTAVTTAKNYTDKTYIGNIKRKEKTMRRPGGYCFIAVKILKTTFEKKDPYLVYTFNDGSDGRIPFV